MQREDCIKITSDWSDPSNSTLIAAGSYLDPRDPLLMDIPSDLQYDQCSPAPILSVIVFCSYMVGVHGFLRGTLLSIPARLAQGQCSPAPILSVIVLCSYMAGVFKRFLFCVLYIVHSKR